MKALSLKIRFAIGMSVGALALVAGISTVAIVLAEDDILRTLSAEEVDTVSRVADGLDEDLRFAIDVLADSAAATPLDVAVDPTRFDAFTAQHPALLRLFEQVFVIDAGGVVVSAYPKQPAALVGLALGDRDYFRRVLATGKPVLSDPLRGRASGSAIVDAAAPLVDADGRVRAVMVGILPLTRKSFLATLSQARVGRTGHFFVVTSGPEPIYVAHPDARMRMRPVVSDGDRAAATAGVGAAAGAIESTIDDGRRALVAYKPLSVARWVVAAALPRDEALEAVAHARERMVRLGVVAALVVLATVWTFAWFLFRPLARLRREVETIAADPAIDALATVGLRDEVGEVAVAFNAMRDAQRASEAMRLASDQERRRLVAILESSQDLVAMADVRGGLTYLNASAREMLGIPLDTDVATLSARDHVPRWAIDRLLTQGVRTALREGLWVGETAVVGVDGREVPVDQTLIAHRNVDGRLEFFSTILHDTSAAQREAQALQASEARMLSIADALPVHVSYLDREYRYRFVNSVYEKHFGVPKSRIIGRSVRELIGDEAYRTYAPFLARAALGETQTFEVDSRSGVRPAHLLVKLIPQFDAVGAIVGYHFIHQDVTDHKVENQRLSQLARADALTGLANRIGFDAALADAMARSRHHLSAMALFYLDVDRFKSINDGHGHAIGDKLLRGFAGRLVRAVRSADVAARLGGDEFVVIAEGVRNVDDVRSIAGKILRAMRTPFTFDGITLSITTSVGVAVYAGEPLDAEAFVRRADAALYRAKDAGRNRYALDDDTQTFGTTSLWSEHSDQVA